MPDGDGGRSVVSRSGIPEKELKGIVRIVSREFGSFPQSARLVRYASQVPAVPFVDAPWP